MHGSKCHQVQHPWPCNAIAGVSRRMRPGLLDSQPAEVWGSPPSNRFLADPGGYCAEESARSRLNPRAILEDRRSARIRRGRDKAHAEKSLTPIDCMGCSVLSAPCR